MCKKKTQNTIKYQKTMNKASFLFSSIRMGEIIIPAYVTVLFPGSTEIMNVESA